MQSTSPTASITTTRMALGTLYHPTTIIPDSEPHDQSLDLSADLFPGEPAPSWSSYFYYCTILWWLFPLPCWPSPRRWHGNGWQRSIIWLWQEIHVSSFLCLWLSFCSICIHISITPFIHMFWKIKQILDFINLKYVKRNLITLYSVDGRRSLLVD